MLQKPLFVFYFLGVTISKAYFILFVDDAKLYETTLQKTNFNFFYNFYIRSNGS
jgi:hypothetical protein